MVHFDLGIYNQNECYYILEIGMVKIEVGVCDYWRDVDIGNKGSQRLRGIYSWVWYKTNTSIWHFPWRTCVDSLLIR